MGINKKKLLEDLKRLDAKEGELGLIDVEKHEREEVKYQVYSFGYFVGGGWGDI